MKEKVSNSVKEYQNEEFGHRFSLNNISISLTEAVALKRNMKEILNIKCSGTFSQHSLNIPQIWDSLLFE